MKKIKLVFFSVMIFGVFTLQSCSTSNKSIVKTPLNVKSDIKCNFIYLNEPNLEIVKEFIKRKDTFFVNAYEKLLFHATIELDKIPNPVTNKTQIPPSGDKHDYLSIAPYRWPNPTTVNGFPWILKDGEINPMTTGNDTDFMRLSELFNSLDVLSMAYYFSNDIKYANKAKSILNSWFINAETKVNPHVKYGQGIPGEVEGRRAGMISWSRISTVINTIQLLKVKNLLNRSEIETLNLWFQSYYSWMKTDEMGIENDNGKQNHSTNYDYQMVGIARFLGLELEAKTRLEAAKEKRINVQINPDGKQPYELGRTKSVHYCSMNLRVMSLLAELGMPLGIDLLNYTSNDGRSMKNAFEFLKPFAEGAEQWQYDQIGGAEEAINKEMKPMFSIASTIFKTDLIGNNKESFKFLSYLEKLKYPPLMKLNEYKIN